MMPIEMQRRNTVAMSAQNSFFNIVLRGLLVFFGISSCLGTIWYSASLSNIKLLCGLIAGLAGIFLGFSNVQVRKSLLRKLALIVLAIIGGFSSLFLGILNVKLHGTLLAGAPHFLPSVLYATVLVVILRL